MNIVLFEDQFVSRLSPMNACRPTYAITCGGLRLWDFFRDFMVADFSVSSLTGVVRSHLQTIQALDYLGTPSARVPTQKTLFVNASLVPHVDLIRELLRWATHENGGVLQTEERWAAVLLPAGSSVELGAAAEPDRLQSQLAIMAEGLPSHRLAQSKVQLLEYPHEVIRAHMEIMCGNLRHRLSRQQFTEHQEGVFVGRDVAIHPQTAFDTTQGPIVVEDFAKIGPFAVVSGPTLIGSGAHVKPHAYLRECVCLGGTTRVGGEVEASILEAYTNKQHFGYLGHSYLGSWINFGAGTSNSDLKNTYGKIRMDYPSGRVETEMQFMGCVVGDYAKTAINTSIYTGKLIGCCSMVYGMATANVPSFANFAASLQQVTELPADVMIETQRRMFGRRGIVQRPCDIQLLRDLYQFAQSERQLVNRPLSL